MHGLLLMTILAGMADLAHETESVDAAIGFEGCSTMSDTARCYEIASERPLKVQAASDLAGTWRLVRTPNPYGGPDAVSILRTADLSRSDPDLAGLMVRCTEVDVGVAIVVVRPFPPHTRPRITIVGGGKQTNFDARVLPPGAAVILPSDAVALLDGPWQALAEVSVEVEHEGDRIRGVVPLAGLRPALEALRTNCRSR